jgi:hypothetical protein
MNLVYKATFVKKDGTNRNIVFYNLDQLPPEFIAQRIKGIRNNNLKEGSRMVYDLEVRDFRIINEKTLIGEIQQMPLDTIYPDGYIL